MYLLYLNISMLITVAISINFTSVSLAEIFENYFLMGCKDFALTETRSQ